MKTIDFADICLRTPLNTTAQRVVRNNAEKDAQDEWFCLSDNYQNILARLQDKTLDKSARILLESQKQAIVRRKKALLNDYPFLAECRAL